MPMAGGSPTPPVGRFCRRCGGAWPSWRWPPMASSLSMRAIGCCGAACRWRLWAGAAMSSSPTSCRSSTTALPHPPSRRRAAGSPAGWRTGSSCHCGRSLDLRTLRPTAQPCGPARGLAFRLAEGYGSLERPAGRSLRTLPSADRARLGAARRSFRLAPSVRARPHQAQGDRGQGSALAAAPPVPARAAHHRPCRAARCGAAARDGPPGPGLRGAFPVSRCASTCSSGSRRASGAAARRDDPFVLPAELAAEAGLAREELAALVTSIGLQRRPRPRGRSRSRRTRRRRARGPARPQPAAASRPASPFAVLAGLQGRRVSEAAASAARPVAMACALCTVARPGGSAGRGATRAAQQSAGHQDAHRWCAKATSSRLPSPGRCACCASATSADAADRRPRPPCSTRRFTSGDQLPPASFR